MESHAQSVEDYLIEGLSFKLSPGASYVTSRRSVSFFPTGGNAYSPGGVKVIKVMLNGDGWLDPSTFRFSYSLQNLFSDTTSATNKILRTLGGPWSFFRRMRITVGGQVCEDIDMYNRTHEMFHNLVSQERKIDDLVQGFGIEADNLRNMGVHPEGKRQYAGRTIELGQLAGAATPQPYLSCIEYYGIDEGDSKTVFFKPLAGIFNQHKYIPLKYCPIQIEFEVVNNYNDAVLYPSATTSIDASQFLLNQCSNQWLISNVQCKCDLVTLDNGLENEYAAHLLSGKSLPISYDTYITQYQTVAGGDYAVNIARAFTRLKSVFVTFYGKAPGVKDNTDLNESGAEMRKAFNDFYHPQAHNDYPISSHEVEFQMQLGSKMYPEYPIRSAQEAFTQLQKCLGIQDSAFMGVEIQPYNYLDDKFIIGIDTEKVLCASYTGENTKSGSLMTLKLKQTTVPTVHQVTGMYITLHSDCILNIRDTGVEIFD